MNLNVRCFDESPNLEFPWDRLFERGQRKSIKAFSLRSRGLRLGLNGCHLVECFL